MHSSKSERRITMKTYSNNDDVAKDKLNKKIKRRTRKKRIRVFLILYCCLAITVLAFKLFSNIYLFVEDKQPKIQDFVMATNGSNLQTNSMDNLEATLDETSWCLILVNKWNNIPDGYEVERIELKNGEFVDKRIYPKLQKMFDAARSDNIYPIVASGYRTTEKQQSLMDAKIADYKAEGYVIEEAITKAEAWVAIPGTSEHQIGLGVDINADGVHSTGEEVYAWLKQNSYKFGFIRRYPADKTEITGVISEPWHYRYVGIEAATEIENQGICLEEYLDKIH